MKSSLFPLIFFFFSLLGILSCKNDQQATPMSTQGIFEFSEELFLEDESIPEYLDAEKVLCKGKGLKVARCISEQLKTGICLGILKEGKKVYVVEISCDEVKEPEVEEVQEVQEVQETIEN